MSAAHDLNPYDVEQDAKQRREGPATRLDDVPLVLDTAGAARLLRCSSNLVRELAEAGTLPGRKVGKDWRFSRDAVLASLAGDQSPPRAQKG